MIANIKSPTQVSNVVNFPRTIEDRSCNRSRILKPLSFDMSDFNKKKSRNLDFLALTTEEVESMEGNFNDMENRINNAETRINEAEKRMRLDSKEREDRIEARQSELLSNLEKRFADMDNKIEKSNDELNKKFEKYMDKIDSKFDKMDEKIDGNNKYLRSLTITTIVGIAAMVIAVLLAVR